MTDCVRCKKRTAEPDKKYCQVCFEYNKTAARQRAKRLKDGGLCQKCGQPRKFRNTLCEDCLSQTSKNLHKRDAERLSQGLCVKCGLNKHEPGVQRCSKCKIRDNNKAYQKRYGISRTDVLNLLNQQNNLCKICDIAFQDNFVVDHCHTTNRIRGLLCQSCNLFLGRYEASQHLLSRIQSYLNGTP